MIMGSGTWNRAKFAEYSRSMGRSVGASGAVDGNYSAQEMFKSRALDSALNVYNKVRECRDSDEHPATVPVILALDVTGSMGQAAVEVAKKLNIVMTELYEKTKDVEFLIMGIGDLAYDRAPIQASQFESDIRIAEQLDKVYFEFGGGGNGYESYTAAWYFALNHTSLDCLARGQKGLIITMGDEALNPYLPAEPLRRTLGCGVERDVETGDLYKKVTEKFDVYHLAVIDRLSCGERYREQIQRTFGSLLGERLRTVSIDDIALAITNIVTDFAGRDNPVGTAAVTTGTVTEARCTADKIKEAARKLISW